MNNPLKRSQNMSDTIVDAVSNVSQENMQKIATGSKAALDKGRVVAKQVRKNSLIKVVERNPAKTLGLVAALGIAAYCIFSKRNRQTQQAEHE